MTNTKNTAELFLSYEFAVIDAENATKVFANSMASEFYLSMPYEAYTAQSAKFKADLIAARAAIGKPIQENSAQKAFDRAIDAMNKFLKTADAETFTAPKASSQLDPVKAADAKRKADERAADESAAIALQADTLKKVKGKNLREQLLAAKTELAVRTDKIAAAASKLIAAQVKTLDDIATKTIREDVRKRVALANGDQLEMVRAILTADSKLANALFAKMFPKAKTTADKKTS